MKKDFFFKTATLSWDDFVTAVSAPRVVASYRVTFGASLAAAVTNAFFGVLVAWELVRYRFPGKKLIDALVDLPFALPTAVAGITLASIYSSNGWLGRYLEPRGIKIAFTPLGIVVAMIFIGLPFVVRTVQPVLEELDLEIEEAASCLGASRWQTFRRVLLPTTLPAILTGSALSFARAVGEYGSIIFIAGNMARSRLRCATSFRWGRWSGSTSPCRKATGASRSTCRATRRTSWR